MLTPLGAGLRANWEALCAGHSAIRILEDARFASGPLPLSAFDPNFWPTPEQPRFDYLLEQLAIGLRKNSPVDLASAETLIILSTTKGNIGLMESDPSDERLHLSYSAERIAALYGNPNPPLVISNACISGISAFIVARRYLMQGLFRHVVIFGCDVLSRFVISGFQSFHAISNEPCRPFDDERKGINLGEGAAAAILSLDVPGPVRIGEGLITNDANHISGPSRTGEELAFAIRHALRTSGGEMVLPHMICAHGTATAYNDEMESLAIEASGLSDVPVFSLKWAYGHTLGAAGVLETVVLAEGLKRNIILPNLNFSAPGVSGRITVSTQLEHRPMQYALKTGSGFGGCNAALLMEKG